MPDGDEQKRTNYFWLLLPFIITSCFVIPMAIHGPNRGEEESFWFIFLPGIALCILPWAKVASLGIQTLFEAGSLMITKSMYESNPRLAELRDKGKKWGIIAVLTWIVLFFTMMIGVGILNAGKSEHRPKPDNVSDKTSNRYSEVEYHRMAAQTRVNNIPPPFIENSAANQRLRFYDNLINRLFLLPFLAMLAGIIYLVRYLIGKWWKKENKIPLVWKIVPVLIVACFVLPIMAIFAIAVPMKSTVRAESLRFLKSVTGNVTVIVNGKTVDMPRDIVAELKKLAKIPAHHSSPMQRICVQVVDANYSLTFELGRDSKRPSEYWVFYPGYDLTALNEIGRVTTTIFDDY
jgi:amino acid transporter